MPLGTSVTAVDGEKWGLSQTKGVLLGYSPPVCYTEGTFSMKVNTGWPVIFVHTLGFFLGLGMKLVEL